MPVESPGRYAGDTLQPSGFRGAIVAASTAFSMSPAAGSGRILQRYGEVEDQAAVVPVAACKPMRYSPIAPLLKVPIRSLA